MTANVTGHRADTALLPVAVLVGRLPRALAGAFILAAVALSFPMEVLYLRDVLG